MEQKPILNNDVQKIKSKIKTLNIIAIVLLVIQLLGYITSMKGNDVDSPNKSIGYYVGFNLWIIISIILFIKASTLQSKIDEIKKNETPNTQN